METEMKERTVKIYSKGEGGQHYESDDGRVVIYLDPNFETECDAPHPVRMLASVFELFADHYKSKMQSNVGFTRRGKYVSWYCDGHALHYYSQWVAQVDGDWTDDVYERFSYALDAASKALGEKVTVGRRPRVAPVVEPATVTCGPETFEQFLLRDEVEALQTALARYDELVSEGQGEFLDDDLHARQVARLAELRSRLAA